MQMKSYSTQPLAWLLSRNTTSSRSIHGVTCPSTSFLLWLNSIPLLICPFCLSIHQSVIWVVSTLWLFVTSAAVNVCLPKRTGCFWEETVSPLLQWKQYSQVPAGTEQSWAGSPSIPPWLYMMVRHFPGALLLWLFRLRMPGYESFTLTSEMGTY